MSDAKHTWPVGYDVTADGHAYSDSGWRGKGRRRLTPVVDDDGYWCVRMNVNGTRRKFRLHRLVAEAFVPGRADGLEVRHINGDKSDNRAANLSWGTAAENAADRERHGRTARGLSHSMKIRRIANANAHLIAAAPDLLAVCEAFNAQYDSMGGGVEDFPWVDLIKAIAKAKGAK